MIVLVWLKRFNLLRFRLRNSLFKTEAVDQFRFYFPIMNLHENMLQFTVGSAYVCWLCCRNDLFVFDWHCLSAGRSHCDFLFHVIVSVSLCVLWSISKCPLPMELQRSKCKSSTVFGRNDSLSSPNETVSKSWISRWQTPCIYGANCRLGVLLNQPRRLVHSFWFNYRRLQWLCPLPYFAWIWLAFSYILKSFTPIGWHLISFYLAANPTNQLWHCHCVWRLSGKYHMHISFLLFWQNCYGFVWQNDRCVVRCGLAGCVD